jgi:hypothetical protein
MKTDEFEMVPEKPRRILGCGCMVWTVVVVFVFFIAMMGGSFGYFEMGGYLVLGWMGFLQRTLPRIELNWDLIGMGMICLGGILIISQYFLRWVTASIAVRRGTNSHWPWRWTWCGAGAIGVLFLVGMAVGGAVHQIGWISNSPEPLLERKGPYAALSNLRALEIGMKIASHGMTNHVGMRQLLWDEKEEVIGLSNDSAKILQSAHVLLIAPSNQVEGWIIFPRDPALMERFGGTISRHDETTRLTAEQLRENLAILANELRPL